VITGDQPHPRAQHRPPCPLLARIQRQADQGKTRASLSCGNWPTPWRLSCDEKAHPRPVTRANVAIVTAYNDMLSAHQPYQGYRTSSRALAELGHSAQVAGGVPPCATA
jgi:phosphogluconate dehydratase